MIFEFEIEKKKYSLFFGMVATQIFTEKSVVTTSNEKGFANLVYAGLCNQADRKDGMRPFYEEAYDLAMLILEQGEELQTKLYNAWAETKPAKNMLDILNKSSDKKKAEEAESQ